MDEVRTSYIRGKRLYLVNRCQPTPCCTNSNSIFNYVPTVAKRIFARTGGKAAIVAPPRRKGILAWSLRGRWRTVAVLRNIFGKCGRNAVRPSDLRKLGRLPAYLSVFESPPPSDKPYDRHRVFFVVTVTSRNRRARVVIVTALPSRVAKARRSSFWRKFPPRKNDRAGHLIKFCL